MTCQKASSEVSRDNGESDEDGGQESYRSRESSRRAWKGKDDQQTSSAGGGTYITLTLTHANFSTKGISGVIEKVFIPQGPMTIASLLLIFAISDFSLKELKSPPRIKQAPNTMMVINVGLIEPCRIQSRVWL